MQSPRANLLRNVPEGRCDRSLARSAWDSGTPKEPSRRVRCDARRLRTDSIIGVTKFRARRSSDMNFSSI